MKAVKIKKCLKHIKEGINCLFEDEKKVISKKETHRMYEIFNLRKLHFMEENSKRVIYDILIPQIRKEFFKETRLLITDNQALSIAVNRFQLYMHMGKIDEMNNLIEM